MASFRKLKSGWSFRITYTSNGKKTQIGKGKFRTKALATDAADALEAKIRHGYDPAKNDISFSEYFESWVERYKIGLVSHSTEVNYLSTAKIIHSYFNDKMLRTITRDDFQDFINYLAAPHGTKPGLARATIQKKVAYIRTCIDYAIEDQIIHRNFAKFVELKGTPSAKADTKFLNFDDYSKLVKALSTDLSLKAMSHYILLFQAFTGARYEEAIGMTWDCIDFETKQAKIEKSWNYKHGGGFGSLKNDASYRTIPINDEVINLLQKLQVDQRKYYLKIGYRDSDNLVFRNQSLEVVGNAGANGALKRTCARIGIREITTHALRHTHGSILLYLGVSIPVVSLRLGHKTIQTTIETYIHVIHELQQRDDDKMKSALDGIMTSVNF